jgi:hypothetical protein
VTRRQKSPEQLRRTSENYPDRHGRAKKAKEGSIRHDRGKSFTNPLDVWKAVLPKPPVRHPL